MTNRLYVSLVVVALLCLAAWTAHAQLPRTSPARQTWDYKLIEVYNNPIGGVVRWGWEEDGKQLPGSATGKMVAKAKELGDQGWELVSVAVAGQPVHYYYWFKRPK